MQVRIAPFHISWGWQVHTDLILSLETNTRPHVGFICRSLAGLHRGDGWSGNRWQPVKHQQPRLWVYLSIKSSTGYTTACTRCRSVTANSHNPPQTPTSRWKKPHVWRRMEMRRGGFIVLCGELGGHIWTTCQEDWMWWQGGKKGGMHIYLWGTVAISDTLVLRLQGLVKMMQFGVTPLWNKPLF